MLMGNYLKILICIIPFLIPDFLIAQNSNPTLLNQLSGLA